MAEITAGAGIERQFAILAKVDTHIKKMGLLVVNTNDSVVVKNSINTTEQLLGEDAKYKVVGFDFAYNDGRGGFVNMPHYRFAMVDTTNDLKVLKTLGLTRKKLVNIQGRYKVWGSKKDKDSLVDLTIAIVDPY
ncbi:hypothetical protein D1007_09264 [Hordeum vulgare]|nr:hypothetical protein D1007_09264 [Hordeum vulgare]